MFPCASWCYHLFLGRNSSDCISISITCQCIITAVSDKARCRRGDWRLVNEPYHMPKFEVVCISTSWRSAKNYLADCLKYQHWPLITLEPDHFSTKWRLDYIQFRTPKHNGCVVLIAWFQSAMAVAISYVVSSLIKCGVPCVTASYEAYVRGEAGWTGSIMVTTGTVKC